MASDHHLLYIFFLNGGSFHFVFRDAFLPQMKRKPFQCIEHLYVSRTSHFICNLLFLNGVTLNLWKTHLRSFFSDIVQVTQSIINNRWDGKSHRTQRFNSTMLLNPVSKWGVKRVYGTVIKCYFCTTYPFLD